LASDPAGLAVNGKLIKIKQLVSSWITQEYGLAASEPRKTWIQKTKLDACIGHFVCG
jgi:hypothetical protein